MFLIRRRKCGTDFVMQNQSVSQFSRSVTSISLWPHGLQHTRYSCPSPTPRVYSNSCPLNWWCHLTISSSIVPLSFCLQSFPALGSFQMNQLFASGGQTKHLSFSFNIRPSNEHSGLISFRMDWLDCCITNHPKTERHRVTINMYFLTLFQRIRNLGAGCLG